MRAEEREEVLRAFAGGALSVPCACDICLIPVWEGSDCPNVEVLLMARPTLSNIVCLQQFGRGTRKAPSKESLVVFDFADNAGLLQPELEPVAADPHPALSGWLPGPRPP